MIWLLLSTAPLAAEISIPRDLYLSLLPAQDPPQRPGPRPWVGRRDVVVTPKGGKIAVDVTWRIEVDKPGWVDLPLAPLTMELVSARLDGRPADLVTADDHYRYSAYVTRPLTLTLALLQPAELRRGTSLVLHPAAIGTLTVVTPDPVVRVSSEAGEAVRVGDRFLIREERLTLETVGERARQDRALQMVGRSGLGLTVSDATLDVRGRLQWRISSGQVDRVAFTGTGFGADLTVEGPNVDRWERQGDRVEVVLKRPERTLVDVAVAWSSTLPDTDVSAVTVPELTPLDTYRVERALQVGRDGDREVVPRVSGWLAVAQNALPEVARSLVRGTPTAAFTAQDVSAATLELLRFQPAEAPPTFVDVASYRGVLSAEGRLLLRAHYTVRNDRGSHLRVRLPPGATLVSAKVGSEAALVAREGEVLLVPLLKSVETLRGLIDFPVRLVMLLDGEPFPRKVDRPLELPVVDVDVAVVRTELHLPPGWRDRGRIGESHRVAAFTEGEGITYGFASGDESIATSDALYQDALGSWMKNDFSGSQQAIDQLKALGASNANIDRLQSNLDLVLSDEDDERVLSRRVKDQARARATDQEQIQVELEKTADGYLASGDYERAEAVYEQAVKIGSTLQRLEQSESREVAAQNSAIAGKLATSKAASGRKNKTVVDFGDVPVTGELKKPEAFYVAPPPPLLPVVATDTDVILPTHGETIRTQHLLLPAGTAPRVQILAKETKR